MAPSVSSSSSLRDFVRGDLLALSAEIGAPIVELVPGILT